MVVTGCGVGVLGGYVLGVVGGCILDKWHSLHVLTLKWSRPSALPLVVKRVPMYPNLEKYFSK